MKHINLRSLGHLLELRVKLTKSCSRKCPIFSVKAGLHSPLRFDGRYFDAIGSLEKEAIPLVQSDVTVKKKPKKVVELSSTFFYPPRKKL